MGKVLIREASGAPETPRANAPGAAARVEKRYADTGTAMQFQVLTRDQRVVSELSTILSGGGPLPADRLCGDLATLRGRLRNAPAQVVLVDIDPDPLEKLERLAPLINGFGDARFVALCEEPDNAVLLRAMQSGIRHVQDKAGMAAVLEAVLVQLSVGPAAQQAGLQGEAVLVLQASGGCGSTTVAVNAANELHVASGGLSLLVDMDEVYGAAACYLDLSGRYGVDEVISHGSEIDGHLVTSTAVEFNPGLHVLLSPATTDFGANTALFSQNMEPMIHAAKSVFEFTVIDAPRAPVGAAARMASVCDHVWVVLQPLVKDVRFARQLCWELSERGVNRDRLRIVLNRFARRAPVSFREVETALRGFKISTLRNDFKSAAQGLNYGKPLTEQAKRSGLRKDIVKLVMELPSLVRKPG